MKEGDYRQDFFISDTGHINLRLKVTTDDKEEREKIVGELMGMIFKEKHFVMPESVKVDQMYFHNQNPLTTLMTAKEQVLNDIERIFDEAISRDKA